MPGLRKLLLIMPLIILSSHAKSEATLGAMVSESSVNYKNLTIGSAKFHVKHKDGIVSPAVESYLYIKERDETPVICTAIYGHSLKIKIEENKTAPIVYVFYHTGGNQYALKLYYLHNNKLKAFKNNDSLLSSNMRSITVKNNKITVKKYYCT